MLAAGHCFPHGHAFSRERSGGPSPSPGPGPGPGQRGEDAVFVGLAKVGHGKARDGLGLGAGHDDTVLC